MTGISDSFACVLLLKTGETKPRQVLEPYSRTGGSGQQLVLLTAPLLPAAPSTQSRSKAAQAFLGLYPVWVQHTPCQATVPGELAAPERLDISRGTILNPTEVLPPHSKQFQAATREEWDTCPQAITKADKQRKCLHLGGDSKPQAHLQLWALFPSRKEHHPVSQAFIQPRKTTTF